MATVPFGSFSDKFVRYVLCISVRTSYMFIIPYDKILNRDWLM